MPFDPVLERFLTFNAWPVLSNYESLVHSRRVAREFAVTHRSSITVHSVEDRILYSESSPFTVRIYQPLREISGVSQHTLLPVVVFYHGGGFARGDRETHDGIARRICDKTSSIVISVDYRLAPEHPHPAAVEDAWTALEWSSQHAQELGGDPRRLAVAGDSAGANLATVVAQKARDEKGPALLFQLLWYPVACFDLSLPSVAENAHAPVLTLADLKLYARYYFGRDEGDPSELPATIAPANGNLVGLPPTYLATAQYDPLRDDGARYAELLRHAGVSVHYHLADTLVHGYAGFAAVVPAAQEAVDRSLSALKTALFADS